MLQLYTEDYQLSRKLVTLLKHFMGIRVRGPQAVVDSLRRGFLRLGISSQWNKYPDVFATVGVLSGPKVLREMVGLKRRGKLGRLIAGPNIAALPHEYGSLMASPEIDQILVPSQWVYNWWVHLRPSLAPKISLWAAGVADNGPLVNPTGSVLIFQKNGPPEILEQVKYCCNERHLTCEVLAYGSFQPSDYKAALARCRMMIYLSESESQGLALHEAWMGGVPTLVWNRGFITYKGLRWDDVATSAPYLTDTCGMFFTGVEDFPKKFDLFIQNLLNFQPREYSLAHFTDEQCARAYCKLIS